jgi:hypothetical protein
MLFLLISKLLISFLIMITENIVTKKKVVLYEYLGAVAVAVAF